MGISIKRPGVGLRTVKIALNPEMLQEMLDLPEGAWVVAVQADMDPTRIEVLIESEDFPERADPNASSPVLPAMVDVITEDVDHDDGTEETKVISRRYFWEWPSIKAQTPSGRMGMPE